MSVSQRSPNRAVVPSPRREPVKVLMIIGWGRSGSTILSDLLGELDGFFSAGELHYLWLRGLVRRRSCGCRQPIPDCSVWSSVVQSETFTSAMQGLAPEEVTQLQSEAVRMKHVGRVMRLPSGERSGWDALDRYRQVLDGAYRSIREITGARVIVDSSKRPIDAAVARLIEHVDLYVLHLVRDPRGVAYSRIRTKEAFGHEMRRSGPASSTVRWIHRNLAGEVLRRRLPRDRSMLIRYEDLVEDPRATVREIAAFLGEHVTSWPFTDDRTALLTGSHAVSGNQSRFTHGPVEIHSDHEWMTRQGRLDRLLATGIALPLLHRYGYRISIRGKRRFHNDE